MSNPKIGPDRDDALWHAAHGLAPDTVAAIEPAGTGANSRVYRVRCTEADYALKQYPAAPRETKDRLGVEWLVLSFLTENGVQEVPRPIARSPERGFILMEWIEGGPVGRHTLADLDQAIGFMTRIFGLSSLPEAHSFPLAAEACLSRASIVEQIDRRLDAFERNDQLDPFLVERFLPAYHEARDNVLRSDWASDLPTGQRRLIPADFGFHNALRASDGRLRYFDFDYFGWDDPVKLAADFILHPAMSLTPDDEKHVATAFAAALPGDAQFLPRLDALLPLYALRWSLILLNPFRADRKPIEDVIQSDHERLRLQQLQKAKRMAVRALESPNGWFTDD